MSATCKTLCCPSRFGTGGRGAGGSRSKNLLEGPMKQMLDCEAPGRSSEARHQQHQKPENRDSQHINPRGLFLSSQKPFNDAL